MRDDLVRRISDLIEEYGKTRDGRHVLDPAVLGYARELWLRRTIDVETLRLLSALHWCRYRSQPEPANEWDGNVVAEYSLVLRFIRQDLVIGPVRQAVAEFMPPPGHTARSLIEIAQPLLKDIDESGDYEPGKHFGRVLDILNRAYNAARDDASLRATCLEIISTALQGHYLRSGLEGYGEAALQAALSAIEAQPDGHDRAIYQANLASLLLIRQERTDDRRFLDGAVEAGRAAVAADPPGEILAGALTNLETALETRLERDDDPADREALIQVLRRLVELYADEDPWRGRGLARLCTAYQRRYADAEDPADLDLAIRFGEQAAGVLEDGDEDKATVLIPALASAYWFRYMRGFDDADLDAAISWGRRAVAGTPPGKKAHANALSNLGTCLQDRYRRHGRAADLAEAITMGEAALGELAEGDPDVGKARSMLGTSLLARFERNGSLADINAAIEHCREAARVTPAGTPERERAEILSNLGVAYRERYSVLSLAGDVDASILAFREGAQLAPRNALLRSMFGTVLRIAYQRSRQPEDLDEAIENLRVGAESADARDPERPGFLSVYGEGLLARYEVGRDPDDLEAAIAACREAADATPTGHRYFASFRLRLAAVRQARYAAFGLTEDLDEAIQAFELAVGAIPDTDR